MQAQFALCLEVLTVTQGYTFVRELLPQLRVRALAPGYRGAHMVHLLFDRLNFLGTLLHLTYAMAAVYLD